jgi:hypothetical protein
MIIIKALDGSEAGESRRFLEEALCIAMLRARETKKEQGLFSKGMAPFAAVNGLAWEKSYGPKISRKFCAGRIRGQNGPN